MIKEIRMLLNMTQRQFSEYTGIPIRTLQHWEQGDRKPPEYIYSLLKRLIKKELNM